MKIKTSDKRKEFVPYSMTIEFESEKEHKMFLEIVEYVKIKFNDPMLSNGYMGDVSDLANHLSEMARRLYAEMAIDFSNE